MTDFPHGWTLNTVQNASGAPASITVPGVTGITHVLDSYVARISNFGASAFQAVLTVTAAGVTVITWLLVAQAAGGLDESSLGGLDIAGYAGAPIIVAFQTATGTGQAELLTIQGHDL